MTEKEMAFIFRVFNKWAVKNYVATDASGSRSASSRNSMQKSEY
jgi:hypothetical protein